MERIIHLNITQDITHGTTIIFGDYIQLYTTTKK